MCESIYHHADDSANRAIYYIGVHMCAIEERERKCGLDLAFSVQSALFNDRELPVYQTH